MAKLANNNYHCVVFNNNFRDQINTEYPSLYIHQMNRIRSKPKIQEKENDEKIFLSFGNNVHLPDELIDKLNWRIGDEIYADMFDEDLKQIVIGKKLECDDAVKVLDRISELLNQ